VSKKFVCAIGRPLGSVAFGGATQCCDDGYFVNAENTCSECPAGSSCIKGIKQSCPAGTYSSNTKSKYCLECAINSVSFGGSTGCIHEGYYLNITSNASVLCPAGSYCTKAHKHQCPAGYPCTSPGSNSSFDCIDKCCTPGFYWDVQNSTCGRCERGYLCDKSVKRMRPSNKYSNQTSNKYYSLSRWNFVWGRILGLLYVRILHAFQ
jgi:hypothetical protein